ncbi:MAG TPA: ABC transporter permease [Bacillota bacterium]|nr:ABC transporter permease [Bacillota bacterium]
MKRLINGFIGFSILLLAWEGLVISGRFNKSLLPSPLKVLKGMVELFQDGVLITHIQVSLSRFAAGYLTAVCAGIILGLFLGWFHKVWSFLDPVVQVLRPISPIAWFPFIVLWFGIGDLPAMVIIFIAAFYPILLATVAAVGKVDPIYFKVAQNFGIKQPLILTKIVLPAAFPYITIGLHIALGSAWVFLVAGEMVGAQSGLGYLIIDARNNLRADLVLSGIILIGVLGLLLDKMIKIIEKWIGRKWGIVPNERGF